MGNEMLRDYWHPVALSKNVQDKPVPFKLLNENIVLWRAKDGVKAVKDWCAHRGTKLSAGWIDNDQIVCPYHGWTFRGDGKVTCIPALPVEREIPSNAKIPGYQVSERYGVVFVCMGTPKQPIFEVPEFDQPGYKTHILGPHLWKIGAVRNFENFFDEAHFPWVHPGALGNRYNVPMIPNRELQERESSFFFEFDSEAADRLDPKKKMTVNHLTYEIKPPFTLYHDHINPEGEKVMDLFMVTPITETESIRLMVVGRNFALDQPPDKFIQFTTGVWEQDRVIIETQEPSKLDLTSSDQLPIRGPDSPSILYRKMMMRMGESQVI